MKAHGVEKRMESWRVERMATQARFSSCGAHNIRGCELNRTNQLAVCWFHEARQLFDERCRERLLSAACASQSRTGHLASSMVSRQATPPRACSPRACSARSSATSSTRPPGRRPASPMRSKKKWAPPRPARTGAPAAAAKGQPIAAKLEPTCPPGGEAASSAVASSSATPAESGSGDPSSSGSVGLLGLGDLVGIGGGGGALLASEAPRAGATAAARARLEGTTVDFLARRNASLEEECERSAAARRSNAAASSLSLTHAAADLTRTRSTLSALQAASRGGALIGRLSAGLAGRASSTSAGLRGCGESSGPRTLLRPF